MKRNKIFIVALSLLCSGLSYAQTVDAKSEDYKDILTKIFDKHERVIRVLKNKCEISEDEKIYFLENAYLAENNKYSEKVEVKDETFFLDNLNRNIFYLNEIVKEKNLAWVIITFKTHHAISIYMRKLSGEEWAIFDIIHRKSIQLKDSPAVLLYKKISPRLKLKAGSHIKDIKTGMSYEEVKTLMKPYNDILREYKYTAEFKRDTLFVMEYQSFGHYDEHKIYFDEDKKVDRVKFAKEEIEHIIESNKEFIKKYQ